MGSKVKLPQESEGTAEEKQCSGQTELSVAHWNNWRLMTRV